MTFLPIARRELLVAARLPRTYRDRWLTAAAFVALVAALYGTGGQAPVAVFNGWLFKTLAIVCFISAAVCGPILTADTLSAEKREGTLGLLFLTDLRGFDVVLGKFFAHGLNFYFQLLAGLPVLALPLMLGGVTVGQYVRVTLALLNTVFFSLSAGLFVSSCSKSARKATVAAFILVAIFLLGIPILVSQMLWPPVWLETLVGLISPSGTLSLALGVSVGGANYWDSLVCTHGLAWIWLALACLIVPRTWRERAGGMAQSAREQKLQEWSAGTPAQRSRERARLLQENPVAWLDDRQRLQKTAVWSAASIFAIFWSLNATIEPAFWFTSQAVFTTFLVVGWILKVWIASQAAQRFVEDRQSGALELLLGSTLGIATILRGRIAALLRQFGWVTLLVVLVFAILAVLSYVVMDIDWRKSADNFSLPQSWLREQRLTHCLMAGSAIVFLGLDTWAITWVGMEWGLQAKTVVRATLEAFVRVVLLPWLLLFLLILGRQILSRAGSGPDLESTMSLGFLGLGVICDLGFGIAARKRLHRDFRLMAAGEALAGNRRKRLSAWFTGRLKRPVSTRLFADKPSGDSRDSRPPRA